MSDAMKVSAIALVYALASCVLPVLLSDFFVGFAFSIAWLATALFAMARYRASGLWSLIGLPFAATPFYVAWALYDACRSGGDCL